MNTEKRKLLSKILLLNIIIVFIFAVIYFLIGQYENNFVGVLGKMSMLDSFYFSITTQTTVGYGDIRPRSDIAKTFVIFQQLFFMIELVIFAVGVL